MTSWPSSTSRFMQHLIFWADGTVQGSINCCGLSVSHVFRYAAHHEIMCYIIHKPCRDGQMKSY